MGMISTFTVNLFPFVPDLQPYQTGQFCYQRTVGSAACSLCVAAGLSLFLATVVSGLFVFHGCMIGQKSYWDSRFESMELLKGRWAQIIGMVTLLEM